MRFGVMIHAGGVLLATLSAAGAAHADISLRNATGAPLSCRVDARYVRDDGSVHDLVLIEQTPICSGQRIGGAPIWLRLWRPERVRFARLALACDGTLDAQAVRLHAVLEHDDPFWDVDHRSWPRCVPDPFVDTALEIVRDRRADADGYALCGVCRTAPGGAPYRTQQAIDFEYLP